MNKYLMMMSAAAAVLAGTDGASAANVKGGAITLSNGCGLDIREVQKGVYAVQYDSCGSGNGYGQGLARKTPQGKFVDLSDNYSDGTGIAISVDISLPLRNGGTWALWVGFSGTSSFLANSGTYTLGNAPKDGGRSRTETKALITRLKAARAQR